MYIVHFSPIINTHTHTQKYRKTTHVAIEFSDPYMLRAWPSAMRFDSLSNLLSWSCTSHRIREYVYSNWLWVFHAHEHDVCVMDAGRFHVYPKKNNMLVAREKYIFVRTLHNDLLDLRWMPTHWFIYKQHPKQLKPACQCAQCDCSLWVILRQRD